MTFESVIICSPFRPFVKFEFKAGGNTLSFDLKTTETIPLGEGHRLSGITGEISGRYPVPVTSPGGIMENHFELSAESGPVAGQMYAPVGADERMELEALRVE